MDSTNDDTQARKRRTGEHAARVGGRSERVVRDVLDASAKELARVGYAALRMDDVAAAAGVNKTTVYRRWPTKPDLVRATFEWLSQGPLETPDLGSIREDLGSLLAAFVARMASPEKRCIVRMIYADMEHPEVQELVRAMREQQRVPWRTVITRAIERGELPAGSDAQLILDLVLGATSGLVRLNEHKDPGYFAAVIDLVVAGAKHGGAIRKSEVPADAKAHATQ
jgi:AcrR family transcriptional regulator